MRAEDYLRLVSELPVVDWTQLTGGAPFVVLSPHPDDETLGAGGLIAAACEAGVAAAVIIVTDGSGSHPRSLLYPKERLVALRRDEARRATRTLGLSAASLVHLDRHDTAVPTSGPDFDEAVARVSHIVRALGAQTLFVTWRHDPHCDHEASDEIARAVRAACPGLALLAFPIWGWHLPKDAAIAEPAPTGGRIAIGRWRQQKEAAIAAYTSQMTAFIDDDPQGFHFTPETLAPFLRPFEYFIGIGE